MIAKNHQWMAIVCKATLGMLLVAASGVAAANGRDAAWSVAGDYLSSPGESHSRQIDLSSFVMRVWRPTRWPALDVGLQAGLLRANGWSSEDAGLTRSSANAIGALAGVPLRLHTNQAGAVQPFAEFALSYVITDRRWPASDSLDRSARSYAKFDFSLGLDISLNRRYGLSAAARLTHISNGRGLGVDNVNFDGFGVFLAVSRRRDP